MRYSLLLAVTVSFASVPAFAQDDEGSLDIDLGSSRIGGPGLTESERRRVKSWSAPVEFLTEDNLPPPGDKKRLPSLHKLAHDYVSSKQWEDACVKYDTIADEFQSEGIKSHPEGARNAARSYFACARAAGRKNEYEKAEMLLEKSERYGKAGPRHKAIRLKMARDRYRKKLTDGDISGAIKLFKEAQKIKEDEDERIFLGDSLAARMTAADKAGDKVTRDTMMRHLKDVAPQNTDYRNLKDKLETEAGMVGNIVKIVGATVVILLLGTMFMRWKSKRAIGGGKRKNKFIDDDEF